MYNIVKNKRKAVRLKRHLDAQKLKKEVASVMMEMSEKDVYRVMNGK